MKILSRDSGITINFSALKTLLALLAVGVGVFFAVTPSSAAILGTAQNFSVLGASTVTNTGPTTLWGNLGVYPGNAITGQETITINGEAALGTGSVFVHEGDAVAQQAQADSLTAYNFLAGQSVTQNLTGQDLGGMLLNPGVYAFDTSAQLTGTLTLDFGGNPDALFVFQIGTTLTTASASVVDVLNGGENSGIYWQVGTSATLGTTTAFAGNIIADQSVTLNTSATILCGRAIALNAAVTMDSNTISNDCFVYDGSDNGNGGSDDFGSIGFSGDGIGATAVSEPATLSLLALGLMGLLGFSRRRQGVVQA